MSNFPFLDSPWVWPQVWSAADKEKPRLVYFRKAFTLSLTAVTDSLICRVDVSADSRYKLLINGHPACVGP